MALTEYLSVRVPRRGLEALAGREVNRTVVLLRGEHDASTVAALSEAMARAIASTTPISSSTWAGWSSWTRRPSA